MQVRLTIVTSAGQIYLLFFPCIILTAVYWMSRETGTRHTQDALLTHHNPVHYRCFPAPSPIQSHDAGYTNWQIHRTNTAQKEKGE